MPRQTAFPGVEVDRVSTRKAVTAPNAGMGLEVDGELMPDKLKEYAIGEDMLIYDLRVYSVSDTTAKAKGKAFVRAKNPFEADVVQIVNHEYVGQTSDNRPRPKHMVTVGVRK